MSATELELVPAPTAHHPEGPSNWPMWAECINYAPVPEDPEDLEDDPDDVTAKGRGRVKHLAVAMTFSPELTMRQRALNGLTDKEIAEVQFVSATARRIIEENGYNADDLRVEQRVTMFRGESFEVHYFGTADGELGPLDFDWKFGEERNYFPQHVGYALPKMESRGETRRLAFTIYGRLRKVTRHVIDIETARLVGYGLLARRESPFRKATPCQYCGWCANAATCSALVAAPVALNEAREDWMLKLPTPHVSQITDPVWMGAARLLWIKYIKKWGEGVEWASGALAANGVAPLGFRAIPVKGSAEVADTRAAFAALKESLGEEKLWSLMGMPLGAVVKAYQEAQTVSEDKAKVAVLALLTDAKAVTYKSGFTMLRAEKGAEDLIRTALARPRAIDLPEKATD